MPSPVAHEFRPLKFGDPGFKWGRALRFRCIYCSIDHDHVDVDVCSILVARHKAQLAAAKAFEEALEETLKDPA